MGLKVYTSNRLEPLARTLAGIVKNPLPSPFDKEIIIVQSRGMERWISMQLAQIHGICANYWFPFPNHFVKFLFQSFLPEYDCTNLPDTDLMAWKIMDIIPELNHDASFDEINRYLKNGNDLKRFQLAFKLADTFDHYQFYRPEMLLNWDKGKGDHWQAKLWRYISKTYHGKHYAFLRESFFNRLRNLDVQDSYFPQRISVFGISSLPLFHLEILYALSQFTEVHFFLLNPSRQYWADIYSLREISRKLKKIGSGLDEKVLHLETGNSLLASLGNTGREFFYLLNKYDFEDIDIFEEPQMYNLLSMIQGDILDLRDRTNSNKKKSIIRADDRSIQIHSCHSPMREIEILHDFLLKSFEEDPQLKPEDILVMTPDIERYSTYIKAVFDLPPDNPKSIPFSISDGTMKMKNAFVEPFMKILNLPDTRFEATKVFSILESPMVSRRFNLKESQLELIRKWIIESGIRWGIDEQDRKELGLSPTFENTWISGLKRLMLGFTVPEDEHELYKEILPVNISGDDFDTLEGFFLFIQRLIHYTKRLRQEHGLDEWAQMLLEIMDEFFMADEKTQYELESIRNTISRLRIIHEVIQFKGKTGIAPVRYYLGKQFHKRSQTHNFMSKGITFCTMLPMRSIPFKIICLVGMDWNSYPRHDQETEFDLIRQSPRMGDRSLRDEDKYIFLETILSARKTLYISFVGQSLKDDSRMPPSTVVSDLIEYIKEGFQLETGGNIEDHLITYHKSQSYHHEYFAGKERLYSYSEEAFQVLKALKDQIQTHKAFIQEYLSEPDDSFKIIDVEEFKSFFRNPSKFLLKKRLGINLDEEVSVLIDKEPFDLKGLDRYIVEKDLLEGCLKEKDANEIFAKIKAKGIIPHDPTGRCILEKSSTEISFFAKSLKKYISHQQEKTIDLELKLMDCTITGILENIFGNTCICYRYAKIKATDMLNAWINHLILHLVDVDNPRTVLMGIDRGQETRVMVYLFAPVSSPEEILESLVEIFKTGIRRPIPFFPESSLEFAKLMKKNDENDVINRIKHRFYGDEYRFGEGQDPYYDLCFGGLDPFDEEFKRLSKSIFEPLLKHLNNRV